MFSGVRLSLQVRMRVELDQVHHGMHGGHVAVRTIIGGTVADDLPGFEDTWEIFVADANGGVGLVVFQQYVVTWLVFLYQVVFEQKSVFFRVYHDITDICNLADQ